MSMSIMSIAQWSNFQLHVVYTYNNTATDDLRRLAEKWRRKSQEMIHLIALVAMVIRKTYY
jgi:hypothetical protein